MTKKLCLLFLIVLALSACSKSKPKLVYPVAGESIQFKTITLIEKGFLWDTVDGTVDFYTENGVISLPRDFRGIASILVIPEPKPKNPNPPKTDEENIRQHIIDYRDGKKPGPPLKLKVTYKSGVTVEGAIRLQHQKDWDYLKLETSKSIYSIPLCNVREIYLQGRDEGEVMEFSLWILDKHFLPSLAILVFGSFAVSFLFTRLATSKTLARKLSGNTPKRAINRRISHFEAMRREIEILRDGRKDEELDEEEKEDIKAIRRRYVRKANEEDE